MYSLRLKLITNLYIKYFANQISKHGKFHTIKQCALMILINTISVGSRDMQVESLNILREAALS